MGKDLVGSKAKDGKLEVVGQGELVEDVVLVVLD